MRALEVALQKTAIQQAVAGLAEFHRLGFTHGDAETLDLILRACADDDVTRALATSFTSVRRSLTFHLAQAPLSLQCFRAIGRLLRERRQPSR